MKLDTEKLDNMRDWILNSHINLQDVINEVGFPDGYKLSEKEIEYIYEGTEDCNYCGFTFDSAELSEHETEGLICDECFAYLEEE